VGFGSVADCWPLTATPRGKSAEALNVLVGLALSDEAMITERPNTQEAPLSGGRHAPYHMHPTTVA
jgi:hypothetical protein